MPISSRPIKKNCVICNAPFETFHGKTKYCSACKKEAHNTLKRRWDKEHPQQANPPYARLDSPAQINACINCTKAKCTGWCDRMMEVLP